MSRRRVRLGSGLDPHKLAGTIRQIAIADPPLPALVCHLSEKEDSWIHLTAIAGPAEVDAPPVLTGWKLMLGYPTGEPPADLLSRLSITLPAGAGIDEWEAGIYASIHLPPDTSPEAIAALITNIAHRLQSIDAAQSIETALEYP
jgi:hypothetical protein